MIKPTVYLSQIVDEITVCPYCMNDYDGPPYRACCGEVHPAKAYLMANDDCHLVDDVNVFDDTNNAA